MDAIKPQRTFRRRLIHWLFALFALYVIYCGLLYVLQTSLIFPAGFAGQAGDVLPTIDTERIELATDEGTTVAWFVPAPSHAHANSNDDEQERTPRPLAVFFHGNAELIDYQPQIIDLYHAMGVSVLLVEYRGYGHSQGTPSQAHIVADSVAILDQVIKREDVDAQRIVMHGRSIGGGLATQVALQRKPSALIVENTGTSVSSMAWRYGAPPLLVRSPLNTEKAFKQLDIPILIMHAKHDLVFPVKHGHVLHAAASDSTLVLFDADHNTLPGPAEAGLYVDSVRAHLEKAGVLD